MLHAPYGVPALLVLFYLRAGHSPVGGVAPHRHCKVFWGLQHLFVSLCKTLRCNVGVTRCTIWSFAPLWCAYCTTTGTCFSAGHSWHELPILLATCTTSLMCHDDCMRWPDPMSRGHLTSFSCEPVQEDPAHQSFKKKGIETCGVPQKSP